MTLLIQSDVVQYRRETDPTLIPKTKSLACTTLKTLKLKLRL